ncbi:hypothetical protein N0V88_002092 [Collariella sp. IMI 366227]|nr:hypothetical protein N0V88_002092 [Collariella sp. IMI 366227]
MQFSTLIIAALAAVASAGPARMSPRVDCPEVDDIPLCGYPCIEAAATAINCATDDYPCMCASFAELRLAAAACVYENCGLDGTPAVLAAAEAVCAACG